MNPFPLSNRNIELKTEGWFTEDELHGNNTGQNGVS